MADDSQRKGSTDFARQLRKAASVPEQRLWRVLRNRRLAGLKFRRQYTIDRFVVDFACVEQQLIVEVDGESHSDRGAYDQQREAELRKLGWNVVRAPNDEVLRNLEGVLILIVTDAGLDSRTWLSGGYGQMPEGLE